MINNEELLFVVDENNNPIDPKPRSETHVKGYWHRVAHIWVINSDGQILCQKRSLNKDVSPGDWEAWFGGHLSPDTASEDGAVMELNEELGFKSTEEDLKYFKTYKCESIKEFQAIFLYKWDGDINSVQYEQEEIDQLKWFSINELRTLILEQKSSDWVFRGYEEDMLNWLINQLP